MSVRHVWTKFVNTLKKKSESESEMDDFMENLARIHNEFAEDAEKRGEYAIAGVHWRKAITSSNIYEGREFYLRRLLECYEKRLSEYQDKIQELQECSHQIH